MGRLFLSVARSQESKEERVDRVEPVRRCHQIFRSGKQALMVNYRVASLKKVLAALKREHVWIDPKGIEASEFGKFAWIKDSEGNRVELWEPPKGY